MDGSEIVLTDVTRQDQEVIVSQCSVLVRIEQGVNIKTISGGIILLQNFEGLGVVLDLSLHGAAKCITVGDRHFERNKTLRFE